MQYVCIIEVSQGNCKHMHVCSSINQYVEQNARVYCANSTYSHCMKTKQIRIHFANPSTVSLFVCGWTPKLQLYKCWWPQKITPHFPKTPMSTAFHVKTGPQKARKNIYSGFFICFSDNFVGREHYENIKSRGFEWTSTAVTRGSDSDPCSQTGVLSITPPTTAQVVEVALTFSEDASGWIFNLGNSPQNNGYGELFLVMPWHFVILPLKNFCSTVWTSVRANRQSFLCK